MDLIFENWQFVLECLSFVMSCLTAFILYVKTRDVKYLKNLCPKEENPSIEVTSIEEQKPEVYISMSELKKILSVVEDELNADKEVK